MIKKMKNIGMYAFLILVTFISVFPLYWMVSASTNKSVDVSKGVLSFGSHLGENLKNLLANQDVWAALVNSFKYAIIIIAIWTIIKLFRLCFSGVFKQTAGAAIWAIVRAIITPALGIIVLAVIMLMLNKEKKKSLTTMITAVTVAQIPVII